MQDNNIEYCKFIEISFIITKNIYLDAAPDEQDLSSAQKSKLFDETYHINEYQIFFQLMIKENDSWYLTPIYCATHVVTGA